MVLTFNRKMMMALPGEGGSQEPSQAETPQEGYELPAIELDMIVSGTSDGSEADGLTINALNSFSDIDMAMAPFGIRVNDKESKRAPIGYSRYYPYDYVEASKEAPTDSLAPFGPEVPGNPSNTPGV